MADRGRAKQGFELFFVVVTGARAVTEILQFVYQGVPMPHTKVDIRLHGKGNSRVPWRKAGQPRHLIDVVDSDQWVVNKELSLSADACRSSL